MNINLLQSLLIIAIGSGIVMTALLQKIKKGFNIRSGKTMIQVSFIFNMIMGTLFALSFSDTNLMYSVWVGLFSFIGADSLYKAFEDKIFNSIRKEIELEEIKH